LRTILLKYLLPPTAKRVACNTQPDINDKIRQHTLQSLDRYKGSIDDVISEKIDDINAEWDTERVLEADAALMIMITTFLGLRHNRGWLLLTTAISLSLFSHALLGWCPSVPLIRKIGIRTSEEIYNEKTVLKMIRGDFNQENDNVSEMLNAAEKQ
jgi:hypothetical protein